VFGWVLGQREEGKREKKNIFEHSVTADSNHHSNWFVTRRDMYGHVSIAK